jgi:hypothetical protein
MRRLTFLLLLPVVLLIASGCSTTEPTQPDPGTYSGTNGFVINGGSFNNVKVDFAKASLDFIDERGDQLAVTLDQGTLDEEPITVVLALPDANPTAKEYQWVGAADIGPGNASLVIEGEEPIYLSKSGKITITTLGAKGQNAVGTFSGTIENADATATYTINGKFTAARLN